MDIKTVVEDLQDFLSPRLDTYEQAVYLYLFRHGPLQGKSEFTVGFKSARRQMAFGIGESGKPMSESTCYKKLQSLADKGCLEILGTERDGTRIRVRLPSEIDGLIPPQVHAVAVPLEDLDYFNISDNRRSILEREGSRCFYCLRALDSSNFVIEHVVSRPEGDDSYRNVVAACRCCNNRKGSSGVDDFIRALYRDGFLGPEEFEERRRALQRLRDGELRPRHPNVLGG